MPRLWRREGEADSIEEIRRKHPMANLCGISGNTRKFRCKGYPKTKCMFLWRWDSETRELLAAGHHNHGPLVLLENRGRKPGVKNRVKMDEQQKKKNAVNAQKERINEEAADKENSEKNVHKNGEHFALADLEQEVRQLSEHLGVKFRVELECFVLAKVVNGRVGKLLVMTDEPGRVVLCQYQAAQFTGKWEEVAKNGAGANKQALFEELRIRCQSYFN